MTRPAEEIARALPALADATPYQMDDHFDDVILTQRGPLSRAERCVIVFAVAAERLLETCDAETVDAVVERFDRVRAGLVR